MRPKCKIRNVRTDVQLPTINFEAGVVAIQSGTVNTTFDFDRYPALALLDVLTAVRGADARSTYRVKYGYGRPNWLIQAENSWTPPSK